MLVVASPGFAPNTVPELIDYAKKHPGAINYASSGQGSVIHLANEMFNRKAGVEMTHIPYKGGGNAQNDLMAGQCNSISRLPPARCHMLPPAR